MSLVRSQGRLRYGVPATVRSDGRLRYSTQQVQSWGRLRYQSTGQTVRSQRLLRYAALSEEYLQAWQIGGSSSSTPQVSIRVDGAELCPAPYLLTIVQAESAATKFEVRLEDHRGYYHPQNQLGSPWAGKIVRGKPVLIRVTWAGASFELTGTVVGSSWSRSWSTAGKFDFVFHGLDRSKALFRTGVTLPTVRSSRNGDSWHTKKAAANILSEVGLAYNLDLMESSLIRLQNRQDSRPGDLLQSLLDVLWHRWQMRGDTLHVYLPNYHGPYQWSYGTEALILSDDASNDEPSFTNSVMVRRVEETTAPAAPVEHTTFGQFTQSFNPPIEGLYWRKQLQQGGIYSDFRLYRNEALVAVREQRGAPFSGGLMSDVPGAIDKVVFTWGAPSPEGNATGGYGKIQFLGSEHQREDQGWSNEEPRSVTRVNSTSLGAGEDKNHQELTPSSLIDNLNTMRRHADGYLRQQAASAESKALVLPLNLLLAPGQRIQVVDPIIGTQVRYVTEHTMTLSDDPGQRSSRVNTVFYDPNLLLEDE